MFIDEQLYLDNKGRSVKQLREINNKILETFLKKPYQEELRQTMAMARCLPEKIFIDCKAFGVAPYEEVDKLGELKDNGTGFVMGKKLIYKDRFVYPIFDVNNDVMGWVGYDPESNYKYLDSHTYGYKAKYTTFYGMEKIIEYLENGKIIYVTEGIVDCLILRYLGYNAISTLSSVYNSVMVTLMQKYSGRFCIMADKDDTGMTALKYVRRKVPGLLAKTTTLAKDLNDAIIAVGGIENFDINQEVKSI